MDLLHSFVITNVNLDQPSYTINEYIQLERTSRGETIVITQKAGEIYSEEAYQSNGELFYQAIRLALPKINIRIAAPPTNYTQTLYEAIKGRNTFLFKFSSSKGDEIESVEEKSIITRSDITNISKFHNLYIEYSKGQNSKRQNSNWSETRWNYAINQYFAACSSITVDQSIQSLVTGLESLLVKGDGNITFKVSLNAALVLGTTFEERNEVIKKIKKMYNIRSKATHGEITELVRLLKKPDLYSDYFELKSILSQLLYITANMPETEFFDRLDRVLLGGPSFLEEN
nr:HEPN domain-containing protein [Paenibacillus xylanexedens]